MFIRAILVSLTLAGSAVAQQFTDIAPRDGWVVLKTEKTFETLVAESRAASSEGGMAVVTMAGPTDAAARRGIEIPGNRVIGLYNNDFAVRVLELSTAAMIEAPIRVYVTENADGTATFSYKLPSEVFAPYMADAPGLEAIASEIDAAFAKVAEAATH